MNNAYLNRAKKMITDPRILSIMTAKRARMLAQGAKPMVKCDAEDYLDVALLEIAEGKLSYEFPEENEELSLEEKLFADQIEEESADEE